MCCGWGEREFVVEGRRQGSPSSKTAGLHSLSAAIVLAVTCCTLLSLAAAAPAIVTNVEDKAADSLLVRTKRAEEVSFGNLQNEPRVKKADLTAATDMGGGVTHDVMKRRSAPDDESTGEEGDLEGGRGQEDLDEERTAEEDFREDNGAVEREGYQSEDDTAAEEGQEDSAPDDVTDDDRERRKRRAISLTDVTLKRANAVKAGQSGQLAVKRSVSPHRMMTAEHMGALKHAAGGRAKRDLGYDELRELLSDPRLGGVRYEPQELEQDEDVEQYEPPSYNDYEYGADEEKRSPLDDELNADVDQDGYADEDLLERKEEAIENEILRYEVVRKLLKEKEAEQAKEAVLDFLIEAAKDRVREAAAEEERVEEEEEEREEERERASSARLAKRFPYSYEPYGGRWGAMVPGAKRDRNSYERLYRLAQALNDNDEEDEKKKK